jgi:hypothetical protein
MRWRSKTSVSRLKGGCGMYPFGCGEELVVQWLNKTGADHMQKPAGMEPHGESTNLLCKKPVFRPAALFAAVGCEFCKLPRSQRAANVGSRPAIIDLGLHLLQVQTPVCFLVMWSLIGKNLARDFRRREYSYPKDPCTPESENKRPSFSFSDSVQDLFFTPAAQRTCHDEGSRPPWTSSHFGRQSLHSG